MTNTIKCITAAVLTMLAGGLTAATNAKGSNMKNPLTMSIGGSLNVKLVNEYMPDLKENTDSGVCYIKINLTKGSEYTVWISGGSTPDLGFSVDPDYFEDADPPMAFFDYAFRDDGNVQIAYMYADSWSSDDPQHGTYYIWIMGEIGQSTTVRVASGIRSFSQEGEEDNPRRLTMTETRQIDARTQLGDGDFYYVMYLEAGRKYRIWVAGETAQTFISTLQVGDLSPEGDTFYKQPYFSSIFPGLSDGNGVGYVVYPTVSGDYIFDMWSRGAQNFRVLYQAFRKLSPEEHKNKVLLTEDMGYEAEVMPGRENSDGIDNYDAVIDETLCKINVSKGERWVFDTEGANAATNIMMRIYDAAGNILRENATRGGGSADVRATMTASYDGAYYVGVCNPKLLFSDTTNTNYKVKITARQAEEFDGPNDSDDFDPVDDVFTGASMIVPVPGDSSNSVVEACAPHGPHVLSARDWYDWYCFAGRGGVTYRLKASWATEATTDLGLRTQVYKMVNGVASAVTTRGSLTPGSDTMALTFQADADAMYYVCVSAGEPVGDGFRDAPGLDFPAYNLHAVGYLNGYSFGLLKVDTYGAEGTWTLDDLGRTGTMRYPSGATAMVVANVNAKINFQPVAGYTAPAAQTVTPSAGEQLARFGRYVDAMEPRDNSAELADILKGGYSGLAPSSAGATVKRTLWADDDPADAFLFVANAGVYYSFSLKDTTEKLTAGTKLAGDAVMTFYAYKDGALVPIAGLDGVTEVSKRLLDPGYIVVSVHHSAFPADTCYALEYFSANVGTISFASSNVTTSKGDAYVDVVLKRSASEGAVSVRYATTAGTAKPGEDYYPTTGEGIVRWEDGDMANKTIRVRLIPSLIDVWTEARTFDVSIAPFAEDAIVDDEYPAVLSGVDTATVTIAPAVQQNPGTVTLLDQPLEVTAGDGTFALRLERSGGNEGRIAIALYSNPGTAVAGTDYVNITYSVVEWADGEDGVKTVAFKTFDKGSVVAKTVNIGMMPVTADYTAYGYGDYRGCLVPKVATPTAVLTIAGNVAKETGSLLRSAAAAGVGISTPIGSWYSNGTLRSGELAAGGSARIGFTVEGPGFLKVDPQVENGAGTASMIYLVGSGAIQSCTDHSGPMVLTVPSGRQTVLFQVNSPDGEAYASFSNVDNGLPFKWMPLSTVTAAAPLSGAVLPAYGGPLAWTAPAGWNKEEIWYRLKLGVSQAAIPYQASSETLELESPINTPAIANYITNVVSGLGIGQTARFWWTVECAYSTDPTPDSSQLEWITAPGAWNFAIAGQGTPETNVSGFDSFGTAIAPGTPVELVQGVRFEADLSIGGGYSATLSGCVGGKLPPGLTASGLKISGVPSEPGSYTALVEVAVGPYFATTTMLEFNVAEAGTMLGAFGGTLVEDGSAVPNAWGRNLLLTTSVSANGNISAAVNYFGGRLTFSTSSGYDEYDAKTGTSKVLLSTPVVSQGVTYSNTVEMAVRKEALDDPLGMGQEIGTAKLTLWLADASGVLTERTYICGLSRSNGDSAVFTEAMKPFAGYYTVALAPVGPLAGEPSGNGLLTMTLAENGIARFAGILADGTSMSMTSYANLVGDLSNPMACELTVPVWSSAANYSFGGVVRVRPGAANEAGVATSWVVSTSELSWAKDGVASTFDGGGFHLSLSPVGGWYDTVVNLQRYYLDRDFTVETEPVTGIPEYLRYPGLSYSVDSAPHGVSATLSGNVLSPVATSFVMEKERPRRFDLSKSQNPWGVTLAFSRGNGLVTGTFNLIVDDKSSPQGYAATLNHYGLLLMNRDAKAPLDADVWTAGFYLMPSSKAGWLISRPFNIRATAVDRDWSEVELH